MISRPAGSSRPQQSDFRWMALRCPWAVGMSKGLREWPAERIQRLVELWANLTKSVAANARTWRDQINGDCASGVSRPFRTACQPPHPLAMRVAQVGWSAAGTPAFTRFAAIVRNTCGWVEHVLQRRQMFSTLRPSESSAGSPPAPSPNALRQFRRFRPPRARRLPQARP